MNLFALESGLRVFEAPRCFTLLDSVGKTDLFSYSSLPKQSLLNFSFTN